MNFEAADALKQYEKNYFGSYAYVHWPDHEPIWRFRSGEMLGYLEIQSPGELYPTMRHFRRHVYHQIRRLRGDID